MAKYGHFNEFAGKAYLIVTGEPAKINHKSPKAIEFQQYVAIEWRINAKTAADELLRVQCALIDTYQTAKVTPANWGPGDDLMQLAADSVSGGTKGWFQRVMRPIEKS